jgi:hypothetical protein
VNLRKPSDGREIQSDLASEREVDVNTYLVRHCSRKGRSKLSLRTSDGSGVLPSIGVVSSIFRGSG